MQRRYRVSSVGRLALDDSEVLGDSDASSGCAAHECVVLRMTCTFIIIWAYICSPKYDYDVFLSLTTYARTIPWREREGYLDFKAIRTLRTLDYSYYFAQVTF